MEYSRPKVTIDLQEYEDLRDKVDFNERLAEVYLVQNSTRDAYTLVTRLEGRSMELGDIKFASNITDPVKIFNTWTFKAIQKKVKI